MNKRFTLVDCLTKCKGLWDHEINDCIFLIKETDNCDKILNLLNKQEEEIIKLRKENDKLKEKFKKSH